MSVLPMIQTDHRKAAEAVVAKKIVMLMLLLNIIIMLPKRAAKHLLESMAKLR